jgi:hypothetical protein
MKECSICYETTNKFFPLFCCNGYNLCLSCTTKLIKPCCPFCREPIYGLTLNQNMKEDNIINFYENYILWHTTEDRMLESKWYRRHIRRLTKLKNREENRERNKKLSKVYQQVQSQQQRRREKKAFMRNLLYDIKRYC